MAEGERNANEAPMTAAAAQSVSRFFKGVSILYTQEFLSRHTDEPQNPPARRDIFGRTSVAREISPKVIRRLGGA